MNEERTDSMWDKYLSTDENPWDEEEQPSRRRRIKPKERKMRLAIYIY